GARHVRKDGGQAFLVFQPGGILPAESRDDRVLFVDVEFALDRVLPVVERLRQELHGLVAERLKEGYLGSRVAGDDGVAALARALQCAEEEGLVLLDRAAD